LGARTRPSTLEWYVGLVKSSALIGLGCQGSRVESEATSLPSRDFAQRELNPAVARFEAGLLSVWDLDFLHGCVDEQHYDNGA
jgi:hypothetical protein